VNFYNLDYNRESDIENVGIPEQLPEKKNLRMLIEILTTLERADLLF